MSPQSEVSVSVIIPAYNRANLLDRAIKSVLAQTWHEFELLVIDDGSSDDIAQVVNNQQDARLRLIHHEVNRGLAAAWNTGIREASANMVAFLDSDDTWKPEKLFKQLQYQADHPDINVFGTGYDLIGIHRDNCIIPSEKQTQYRWILFENILHLGTTFMVRKSVFEETGGFNEALLRGQDTDWLIRFAKTQPIEIIPESLATIYQHTSRSAEKLEHSRLRMIDLHQTDYAEFGIAFKRKKLAYMYADIVYQYEREGEQSKMREYALKSILQNPLQSPGIYFILLDSLTGWHTKQFAGKAVRKLRKSEKQ